MGPLNLPLGPLAHPSRDHVQTSVLLGFGRTQCLQRSIGVLKSCPWERSLTYVGVHYHDYVSVCFLGCKISTWTGRYTSILPIQHICLNVFHTSHQMNGRHWPLIQHPSHPFTKKQRGPAAAIIDHWIGLTVKAHVLEIASALIWTTRSPSSNESLAWRRLQQHEI